MSKLKALAKLRQFAKGQSVEEYLFTQHRQNLLSLEQSLNSLTESSNIYMTIDSLSVSPSTNQLITYLEDYKIDPSGIESSGVFYIKEDMTVSVSLNLQNIVIVGGQDVSLKGYVDSRLIGELSVFSTNSPDSFTVPSFLEFPVSLRKGNKLSFYISAGVGANPVTIESGVFKMSKLNI